MCGDFACTHIPPRDNGVMDRFQVWVRITSESVNGWVMIGFCKTYDESKKLIQDCGCTVYDHQIVRVTTALK